MKTRDIKPADSTQEAEEKQQEIAKQETASQPARTRAPRAPKKAIEDSTDDAAAQKPAGPAAYRPASAAPQGGNLVFAASACNRPDYRYRRLSQCE